MVPNSRKDGLVVQETADELLIFDLTTNKAICLNETSAIVWKNCDGKKNVAEIAEIFRETTGTKVNEEFVRFTVDQLMKASLLVKDDDALNVFEGLSRREIIKRVGLTTAAALPIVFSLTAPISGIAASCPPAGTGMADIPAGSGCPCTQPQDCSGGSCMSGNRTC